MSLLTGTRANDSAVSSSTLCDCLATAWELHLCLGSQGIDVPVACPGLCSLCWTWSQIWLWEQSLLPSDPFQSGALSPFPVVPAFPLLAVGYVPLRCLACDSSRVSFNSLSQKWFSLELVNSSLP